MHAFWEPAEPNMAKMCPTKELCMKKELCPTKEMCRRYSWTMERVGTV